MVRRHGRYQLQRKTEDALRNSHREELARVAELQAIMGVMPIAMRDSECRYVFGNPGRIRGATTWHTRVCGPLKNHGYEVIEAIDGRNVLEALAGAAFLPSLILLDLTMPVKDARELVPILNRSTRVWPS